MANDVEFEIPEPPEGAESGSRFKQVLFGGAGGAIVFGLVGGLTQKLIFMVGEAFIASGSTLLSGSVIFPALGLLAIATIGIACIYMGAEYMSETVKHDQAAQAHKIICASQGKGKGQAIPSPEPTTQIIPGVMAAQGEDSTPDAAAKQWTDGIQPRAATTSEALKKQEHTSWQDRAAQANAATALRA